MYTQKFWRGLGAIVVIAMLFALIPGVTSAQKSAPSTLPLGTQAGPDAKSAPSEPPLGSQKAALASAMDSYLAKLAPDLRELAKQASASKVPASVAGEIAAGPSEPIRIEVLAQAFNKDEPAEKGSGLTQYQLFQSYFVDGKILARPSLGKAPFQGQVFFGEVLPASLLKIASLDYVVSVIPIVLEKDGQPDQLPPDEPAPAVQPGPDDWAKLRENAEALRANTLPWSEAKAYGDGREMPSPSDWFEVSPAGPHKAEAAWDRGYRGEGVTIAVLDDGIDFGHADLMGTQQIYSSTVNSEYNGWPMVFSPFSMYLYNSNPLYALLGQPAMYYADTSEVADLSPCGSGISCFGYAPIIAWNTQGPAHTYVIADSMTKSGVVHIGTHPDFNFRDYVWGERIAVIVADPHVAGVYDTVYVDIDDDYDFRDEKPLTKADTTSAATLEATKNNMIAYRDMSVPADGIPDLSGGALYFIADGTNPIPVSDWMWVAGGNVPDNGSLVAFTNGSMDSGYSHGTQCASAAVGQGVVDGLLPSFRDLPPGPGKPSGAVFGAAPDAKVVDVSNIYWNHVSSTIDAYLFAAVGYDGIDQTGFSVYNGSSGNEDTDAILANSNSYGNSAADNDGWDYRGQLISQLQRIWAPYEQYLFSTGNGAPGYGTVSEPSPDTGIGVGASTEYGSTGWDSITDTQQIMFNNVASFSNRGPSARAGTGVDILADGAYAAGDESLNHYSIGMWGELNGNLSWDSWGGTSRSAPAALGNLALIYQAFKDLNGDWPTNDVAKALFMSTATDVNYDVFTQGAGSVNSDRSTAVAGGLYGIWVTQPSWTPGDYRGTDYPAFAHLVEPGESYSTTLTVVNPGLTDVAATIDDGTPTLIDSETFDFTITPAMFEGKNPDNFFKSPQWIIPLTADPGFDDWWYNITIPEDTDLMVVRARYPYDEFDANGDYNWDNRFRLAVYNWMDMNGNGIVWDDKDGNGVVNFVSTHNRDQIDMGPDDGDIDWSNPITEIDRWEYSRFDYNRPGGNVLEQWIQDPEGRMLDGLFIGLQQYDASTVQETNFTFEIDFYSYEDVPWLDVSTDNLNVAHDGAADFDATVDVPANMPPGDYEAAIKIYDPGTGEYEGHTTVIPVVIHVAAEFAPGLTLGGQTSFDADSDLPYNNGMVRGDIDWTWRAESGDWRFFYMDVPDSALYGPGTTVLIKDEWNDAAPHTDIDTVVLGPTPSSMGSGYYDFPEPGYFGPYVLDTVASSPNTNFCTATGCGEWRFNTSSGTNEDWVSLPLEDGLHELLQHNVLFEGDKFQVPFTKTLGLLWEDKHEFELSTYVDQGEVGTVVITPSLDLNGLVATGYGMGELLDLTDEPLTADGWTYQFSVQDGYRISIEAVSYDISDIDLYLYYWNGSAWQAYASSTTSSAYEVVDVLNPPDGDWMILVDDYSGTAGHFDLHMEVIQGTGISVTGTTGNPIPAGTGHALTISYDYPMEPGKSYYGLVVLGPPEGPSVKEIPIYIHRLAESAYIEKEVNHDVTFPGSQLQYTVDLFNLSDPAANFLFTDPIPDNTTFVTATNATYDAANNRIVYAGPLPLGFLPPNDEGFESGLVPPPGWTLDVQNLSSTWEASDNPGYRHTGDWGALVPWDYDQDEWLLSPVLGELTGGETTSVWSAGSVYWGVEPYDNYDMNAWLVVDAVGGGDDVLLGNMQDDWTETWTWAHSTFTLPVTLPAGDLRIGYQYVGDDGADGAIDDVVLPGTPAPLPSQVVELTVRVDDATAAGTWITNTGTLTATHDMPTGEQVEPTVSASATSRIGANSAFATSYKVASETAITGGEIDYEVHVINSGGELAEVTLTDPIPAHTSYAWHDTDPPYQHFTYDAGLDQMTWTGNIAPGEEWVFSFGVSVDEDPALWGTELENVATIAWNSTTMDLSASTLVESPVHRYLPFIGKNAVAP